MTFLAVQDTKATTVTTASTDVALDAFVNMSTVVRIFHTGAAPIFGRFGKAAEVVTLTTGIPFAPNVEYYLTKPVAATKISFIVAATTAPLYTTEGLY